MRLALIGCMVLSRDLSHCISRSQHFIHPFWIEQGLHNTPSLLQKRLQQVIDEVEQLNEKQKQDTSCPDDGFDAILLGYGLCSNGVLGLTSKTVPLVIPRTDDCIALFLGSYKKYLDIFNSYKGVYWYLKPWMENESMPSKEHYDRLRKNYTEQYDEDTADYILEEMTSFIPEYETAYFIKSQVYDDAKEREHTKRIAEDFGWAFNETTADLTFFDDLLKGDWDERFLVCPPQHEVAADYSGLKFVAKKIL